MLVYPAHFLSEDSIKDLIGTLNADMPPFADCAQPAVSGGRVGVSEAAVPYIKGGNANKGRSSPAHAHQ